MKRIFFIVFLCMASIANAHRIDAYKYLYVKETGNVYGIESRITEYFSNLGFHLVDSYQIERMSLEDKAMLLYADYDYNIAYNGFSTLVLTLSDSKGITIFKASGQGCTLSAKGDMKNASKKIFKQINALNYNFTPYMYKETNNEQETLSSVPSSEVNKKDTIIEPPFESLHDAQKYFSEHILDNDPIEGIYDIDYSCEALVTTPHIQTPAFNKDHGVFAIYKMRGEEFIYATQALEGNTLGLVALERLGETDTYNLYYDTNGGRKKVRFVHKDLFYFDARDNINIPGRGGYSVTANSLFEFTRRYPTKSRYEEALLNAKEKAKKENEPTKWTGTGFALNDGYVVTNNHVVEKAKSIIIYGVRGDFKTGYKGTIVGVDKTNDLALLKIKLDSTLNIATIPYSVKLAMAEVGEDIFVLGYPLTQLLGNEIKLTNGIISSRTGFDGNVNNYQMSAPVQPGNSGGPVFDKNGNVIGIVVAGIDNKIAQNANYAIKASCLSNLVESVANVSILPTGKTLKGLTLVEQTKKVKDFIYYIECNAED